MTDRLGKLNELPSYVSVEGSTKADDGSTEVGCGMFPVVWNTVFTWRRQFFKVQFTNKMSLQLKETSLHFNDFKTVDGMPFIDLNAYLTDTNYLAEIYASD